MAGPFILVLKTRGIGKKKRECFFHSRFMINFQAQEKSLFLVFHQVPNICLCYCCDILIRFLCSEKGKGRIPCLFILPI